MKTLVSIITPVYNSEKTIASTIESVLNQTFKNFEMIIVDDVSNDNTIEIIKEYQKKDSRIKLIVLNKNSGASVARNMALKEAKGRYIAFLDGDDLWKVDKLEKQLKFMKDKHCAFSYTDYEYMDENSNLLGIIRKCPKKVSYLKMLLGDSIGCLTVMYDTTKVGNIQIPNIKKRNDYALWCKILKEIRIGYKFNEVLAIYRKSDKSLSSGKKISLLKYHYEMHRKVNNFNPILSLFFTFTNGVNFIINTKIRERKR